MIYLEHRSRILGEEEAAIKTVLEQRGMPYCMVSLSEIQRDRVDTKDAELAVGTLPFVKSALRHKGLELPYENPYPEQLAHLRYRRMWKESLKRALVKVDQGQRIFLKPAERAKRFTGFLCENSLDIRFNGCSRNEMVWCSTPVKWVSEWRVYVHQHRRVHTSHYSGSPDIKVNNSVIDEAISQLAEQARFPVSYAIDFGVLSTGETALVEMNDGFSIGYYGQMSKDLYFEMLLARWHQINKDG